MHGSPQTCEGIDVLDRDDRVMNARSPIAQLVVFVLVLIAINVVAALLGLQLRISIIGSIVLTLVVGGVMAVANRRS